MIVFIQHSQFDAFFFLKERANTLSFFSMCNGDKTREKERILYLAFCHSLSLSLPSMFDCGKRLRETRHLPDEIALFSRSRAVRTVFRIPFRVMCENDRAASAKIDFETRDEAHSVTSTTFSLVTDCTLPFRYRRRGARYPLSVVQFSGKYPRAFRALFFAQLCFCVSVSLKRYIESTRDRTRAHAKSRVFHLFLPSVRH